MANFLNCPGDYRIEISGWGLDNSFFVENVDLFWTSEGEKQVHVHRALPQGAIVFIRLLASELGSGTVPVAYQVLEAMPTDCGGRCQLRLAQLHPRSKESLKGKSASNVGRGHKEGNATCAESSRNWNTRRSFNETRDDHYDDQFARSRIAWPRLRKSVVPVHRLKLEFPSFATLRATTVKWIRTSAVLFVILLKNLSFLRI